MAHEHVTHTIYFAVPSSDGCMKVEVKALPSVIESYAHEVWIRLQQGGFDMKSADPAPNLKSGSNIPQGESRVN